MVLRMGRTMMRVVVVVVYVFFVIGQLLSISMSMIAFMDQLLLELVSLVMPVVRFDLLLLQSVLQYCCFMLEARELRDQVRRILAMESV